MAETTENFENYVESIKDKTIFEGDVEIHEDAPVQMINHSDDSNKILRPEQVREEGIVLIADTIAGLDL